MTPTEAIEALRRVRGTLVLHGAYYELDRVVAFLSSLPAESVSPTPEAIMRGEHTYVSTACYHDKHDRCRKVCKFCGAVCRCACHTDEKEEIVLGKWQHEDGTYSVATKREPAPSAERCAARGFNGWGLYQCHLPLGHLGWHEFRPSPGQEASDGLGRADSRSGGSRHESVDGNPLADEVTPADINRWLAKHYEGHAAEGPDACGYCAEDWPCPVVRLGRDWLRMREELSQLRQAAIRWAQDEWREKVEALERELAEARRERDAALEAEAEAQRLSGKAQRKRHEAEQALATAERERDRLERECAYHVERNRHALERHREHERLVEQRADRAERELEAARAVVTLSRAVAFHPRADERNQPLRDALAAYDAARKEAE